MNAPIVKRNEMIDQQCRYEDVNNTALDFVFRMYR